MNVYAYILTNKDNKIEGITTIDAMVLSRLSYAYLENILNKILFTISELSLYLDNIKTNSHDKKLVNLLKDTIRYKEDLNMSFTTVASFLKTVL